VCGLQCNWVTTFTWRVSGEGRKHLHQYRPITDYNLLP
jgi:hypothetical protein